MKETADPTCQSTKLWQHTQYPLLNGHGTMNVLRLSRPCHFGQLRLHWMEQLQSQESIDSGCQVVIIRRDVWEKLSTPMKHEQVMFMESANGQANTTMGTIPSICFSVGEVSLYCLSKWSEMPPSNVSSVYLSCPLCLPSARSSMVAHISCSPIQTRGPPLRFPLMLRSSQGPAIHPALTRRIFNC